MGMAPPTVQGPVLQVVAVLQVPLEATHQVILPVLLVGGRRLVAGPEAEAEAEDVLL